jgi:hypothetical protein
MGGVDPVSDRLVVNREEASDPAEAVAFEVELEGRLSGLVVVTERVGARRVLAAARLALKALRAGAVEAGLNLPLGAVAVGALVHVKPYTIIRSDLGNPGIFMLLLIGYQAYYSQLLSPFL